MKTPDLKKCPFCASNARIMFEPSKDSFYAECIRCRARSEGFCVNRNDKEKFVDNMFGCIEAAANVWNVRRWIPE